MTKYIEVTNNNGTITVDDTTARLVKTRTITFYDSAPAYVPSADVTYLRGYVSDQYILGGYAIQEVNLQSNESIVAVRALAKHTNVAVLGGFVSPTKYLVVLQSNWADTNLHMSDYVIDVYGNVPATEIAGTGLEVFNASGVKIFDSNYYYMDVDNTFSILNTEINPFTAEANTYSIGNYIRTGYEIAMNSCINKVTTHPNTLQPVGSIQYGAVFGDSIYLEKRINTYIQFVYSGGTWTPQSYSSVASGIILNTENIS